MNELVPTLGSPVPIPPGFYNHHEDGLVYVLRVVALSFIVRVETLTCEGELRNFYYPYKGPSNPVNAEIKFWEHYQSVNQ